MYQQITLVGNVGNDPEMRYLPSGVTVTSFSLAVNKSWTNADGQRQDKTLWVRVTAWRKLAETVGQYVTKGQQVLVIGEVEEPRAYTDQKGALRASLEITAQTVRFLGKREGGGGGGSSSHDAGGPPSGGAPSGGGEVHDEEIPF